MAIALIKLNNGTEIIGDVTTVPENAQMIQVNDPMQINYKYVSFQPMPTVGISRYMPFAADTMFVFMLDDIQQLVTPKPSMIEYYDHALINYREDIDQHIDDELMGIVGRSAKRKQTTSSKDEMYKTILEHMEPTGQPN